MRTELPLQAMDAAIGGKIADYLGLCKLKVVSLIVFTAVVGMFLAVPGMPPLDKLLLGSVGIALAAASAAAINHVLDARIDAVMKRTRRRPLPTGHLSRIRGDDFRLRAGAGFDGDPGQLRQRADGGADLPVSDRLRHRLHGLAQAGDAAEHRHRRRRRRCPAGAGLDRHHRRCPRPCAAVVPDHLYLDTAAFLGAGDRPQRRIRARSPSR